jgi:peptidyl-tRNA hydrolase, PTH1 family
LMASSSAAVLHRGTLKVKLIVGLGNPGLRYARTRHNAGFNVVEILASQEHWAWDQRRSHALLASGTNSAERVVLAKPQTYMNDSGVAVGELVRFYKIDLADLLVVCDDLDLPLGRIRVRPGGSAGGQHGLESTIRHLGANTFARIKIGLGRPANGRGENIGFLLSAPQGEERIALDSAIERAADAARLWLVEGVEPTMNRYNG